MLLLLTIVLQIWRSVLHTDNDSLWGAKVGIFLSNPLVVPEKIGRQPIWKITFWIHLNHHNSIQKAHTLRTKRKNKENKIILKERCRWLENQETRPSKEASLDKQPSWQTHVEDKRILRCFWKTNYEKHIRGLELSDVFSSPLLFYTSDYVKSSPQR